MSFAYLNANTIGSVRFTGAVAATNANWFRVPAVVDVSGMEFAFGLGTTKAAASASIFTLTIVDGGASGDAVATTAVLAATATNGPSTGTAWTINKPRTVAGSSATDLDADDYVNLVPTTAGSAASVLVTMAAFIYGKPAGIA